MYKFVCKLRHNTTFVQLLQLSAYVCKAARITCALSPNSAACERVFSLLKNLFGEQQLEALGVEQLEVSGVEMGWNRLAFDAVSLTWTGKGSSVVLETLGPAITMDWPEASYYGYDEVFASNDLGYRGKPFNWITMPDQYTLSAFDRLARQPVLPCARALVLARWRWPRRWCQL